MRRTNHSRGREPFGGSHIQPFLLIFASVVLGACVAFPYFEDSKFSLLISDFGKLFFTTYIAFVITQHYSKKTARDDLHDMAESSGKRIFLQSAQLRELSGEIVSYEPDGERSQIYYPTIASQLNRLAGQAELSFEDILRIAKIDISIPALVDEARSKVVETAPRLEIIKCPFCSEEREVLLSDHAGATKATKCGKCYHHFLLHRLPDGSIKLGYEDHKIIECPNPDCNHKVKITRGPTDFGKKVRNCYECFARIIYDLDRNIVESWSVQIPLDLPEDAISEGRAECPFCSYSVIFTEAKNSRGERLQYCPGCTKLIKVAPRTDSS